MHSTSCRVNIASLLFVFGLLVNQFSLQVSAQIGLEKIDGHLDTSSWVLHESGRIFAAVKSTATVIEYDLQGKEVRQFSVEPTPTEMMIKGDHLVVASTDLASFSVIDLKANKYLGKIPLAGKGPFGLFCSKVDNGLVYGICTTGRSWSDSEIFQADLATMKVRKRAGIQRWGQRNPVHVAMSGDGKWIVPDARGQSSPSGADLMSVDEKKCTFTQIRDHHSSFGQVEAGPANRYWTLGNKLYPLDITSSVRTFRGSPIAVNPKFDLAASLTSNKLSFERFSDASLVKSLPINLSDESTFKSSKRSRSSVKGSEVLVSFDASGTVAVVASKTRCFIVDLKQMQIPLEPLLMINVATKFNVGAGQEFKLPLRLTNEELNSQVTYELKMGPEDASISENELVWKTTAKDIGLHQIQIVAKSKDTSDEVTIELDVAGPKLELNIDITSMDVDRNGKYAVVWGRRILRNKNGSVTLGDSNAVTNEIAVIDLQTQKVLAQKPLAAGVSTAMIQYPYVILAPKSGNIIYRFDAETLEDRKRMFLKQKCVAIVPMPKRQVGVATGQHNFLIKVIDPQTMKDTDSVPIPFNVFHSRGKISFPEVAPDVVDFNSQLLDMKDGTAVMFESNPGLNSLVSGTNRHTGYSHQMRDLSGKVFGRFISRDGIISATGSTVSEFPNRGLIASPYYPVAFAIRAESNNNGFSSKIKSYLETISLVDGSILNSQVFDVSTRNYQSNNRNAKNKFVFKDKIVYYRQNNLFVIPLDSNLDSAPIPLHFPIRKLAPLGVDQPQTISFTAKGGKGKLEYQLISDYQGIKLDPDSGVVTIDTPSLWNSFLKRSTASSMRRRSSNSNRKPVDEKQLMKWFGDSSKGKLAYRVPIHLAVTDEEGQEDHLKPQLVVLAERKKLAAVQSKKRTAQTISRIGRDAERAVGSVFEALSKSFWKAQPRRKVQARPRVYQAKKNDLNTRVEKLDDRLERLENALNSVLKKLDKLEDEK